MGQLAERRDRQKVEREPVARLERPDAALAEHHLVVALLEHVLGRHQELLERRGKASLQQHREPGAADLGQQRVVLHVPGADLDHVSHLDHVLGVADVHELGDDREARLLARFGEEPESLGAEALERVRRGPGLVGAAAQHRRPAVGDRLGHLQGLRAALDGARAGDQREVVASDLAPVHLDDGSLALAELRRGQLVGLQDRHEVVDAGGALQPKGRDAVAVADGADDGQELSGRHVSGAADRLDAVDDGLDLLLSRPLFHHDHHGLRKPFRVKWEYQRGTASGGGLLLGGAVRPSRTPS